MATTAREDQDFADEMQSNIVVSKKALGYAIDWIAANLTPGDVFSDKDLEAWAEANGYTKEE